MNVILPEKTKIKKRQLIIYISIIVFCISSLIISLYIQFYTRINFAEIMEINQKEKLGNKTEEQIKTLKLEFDKIFNNNIEIIEQDSNAIHKNQDLVYTRYNKKQNTNIYEINISIPYINIKNGIIDKYNNEIEEIFISKAKSILSSENKNIIYKVDYTANIHNDILSLAIRSNLKEGTSAQRVIIKTYNYDLRNNKEISLEEIIKLEKLETNTIQNIIYNTIQEEEKKIKELEKLGHKIFDRSVNDNRYKIENSKDFYYTGKNLYIIYAYGNDEITNEIDLIII